MTEAGCKASLASRSEKWESLEQREGSVCSCHPALRHAEEEVQQDTVRARCPQRSVSRPLHAHKMNEALLTVQSWHRASSTPGAAAAHIKYLSSDDLRRV